MAFSKIINDSHSDNYIVGSQVYILGDFSNKEMNELIGNLGDYILSLPAHPIYKASTNITTPYEIKKIKNPIIDFFIDSCGGAENALQNISALLNIAKSRGAIIRTTVLSRAYSAGSLLAIQGTPGFRIMAHDARHMIHYGSTGLTAKNPDDISIMAKQIAAQKEVIMGKYQTYTKIPQSKLNTLMHCESGFLNAPECLKMKICDWILQDSGNIINLKALQSQEQKQK